MLATAIIAAYGLGFGFLNTIQSRLVNNGVRRRFPDALVALWVLLVATMFACAARALAQSSGLADALAYGSAQAIGVVLGGRVANGFMFRKWHPDGKSE